jgi:ABC-type nitrate/sulfonate/bicarbonate transport system substrate-binding protein
VTRRLRIGYVPLMDAGVLLAAERMGFASQHGLTLDLVRETSWANIRDKLALGYFDAAHMLGAAAIASTLGLAQVRAPLVAPLAMNLNGNAITISPALHHQLRDIAEGDLADPLVSGRALGQVIARRRARGAPLVFAHVFPFSTHHYQLRLWMRAAGVDADADLNLVVLPPPFMARGLEQGQIDGFCVGAPWNQLAVESGAGIILHLGLELVRDCPEKVLALRADWAATEPDASLALTRALGDASSWIADAENIPDLAAILTEDAGDPASLETIGRILRGLIRTDRGGSERQAPGYLKLTPDALTPNRTHALWLYAQMVAAGQTVYSEAQAREAAAVYQDPLALREAHGEPAPIVFSGPPFDPDNLPAYLAALI